MRITFEVGHPAHVHFFKYIIWELEKRGHTIKIIAKKKEMTFDLLDFYGFKYEKSGKNIPNLAGKAIEMMKSDMRLLKIARKFKTDIFVSTGAPYSAHVCALLDKPHIAFSYQEHPRLNNLLTCPFTDVIFTPSGFEKDFGKKQFHLNGYNELAYLHPNWFKPDSTIYNELGISKNDSFVIVRFVSWAASHDIGHTGFSNEEKIKLIKAIEKFSIPMITSEGTLPKELQKYHLKIPPHRVHDALYYSKMYIGEGGTMASEAAVMGVPAIYTNDLRLGYVDDQENYGLTYQYNPTKENIPKIIEKIQEILYTNKSVWNEKIIKLLKDKIDVTSFVVWFIENYPKSKDVMKDNPDYQNKFK
jgi:predicted glycosyltransferase